MKILITGGCGFIGTKLQKKLYDLDYNVVIMDNLFPQIHGQNAIFENIYNFKFIKGDVINLEKWIEALDGIEVIVHLAAETGTGQSMYEMERYIATNSIGTANMFNGIRSLGNKSKVKRIILSSSRSVYGEGAYKCNSCNLEPIFPNSRKLADLENKIWDHICDYCKKPLLSINTREDAKLNPASIYAATKLEQEHIIKISSEAMEIDYAILRFQNVYGAGQSLKNPYTGLLTVFTNQINNNNDIHIYEDGKETRDFVHVDDVTEAITLCINEKNTITDIYNVGSGNPTPIEDVAKILVELNNTNTNLIYSNKFRFGDIRHNTASLEKITNKFNFNPKISIKDGLLDFYKWTKTQKKEEDNYLKTEEELKKNGLMS
jgi:dTDP-L-rhamnose 4-epimerase